MAPTAPAATHAQIEALLNFMSEHNDLARGGANGTTGRRAKQLWESLCNSLNSMGSCIKSVEEWQNVWADRKDLAREAAGAARACVRAGAGGDPLDTHSPSEEELRIISMMGKGFGERQTGARVHPFPWGIPETQDPAANSPTQTSANPHSQEQPSISTVAPKRELLRRNQQTLNSRRARPRVQRHLIADSAYSRIIEVEEQRIQLDNRRNELLGEIKDAIVELCNLVREHIARR